MHGQTPAQGDIDTDRVGEGVVQGEDDQGTRPFGEGEDLHRVGAVGVVVEMGEHDALGIARGSRCVADGHHVILSDIRPSGLQLRKGGLSRVLSLSDELLIEDKVLSLFQSRGPGLFGGLSGEVAEYDQKGLLFQGGDDAQDLVQQVFGDRHGPGFRVVQTEGDFVLHQLDGEGDGDALGLEQTELADHPVSSPLGDDGHLVLFFESPGDQGPGEERGFIFNIMEALRYPAAVLLLNHIGVVVIGFRGFAEHVQNCSHDGLLTGLKSINRESGFILTEGGQMSN